jgi:hypothetical protein
MGNLAKAASIRSGNSMISEPMLASQKGAASQHKTSGVSGISGGYDQAREQQYEETASAALSPGRSTLTARQQQIKEKIQKVQDLKKSQKNKLSMTGSFTACGNTNSIPRASHSYQND